MSFAQEMKDFLGASTAIVKSFSEADYRQSMSKYHDVLAAKTQKDMDDPLNAEYKQAQINELKARTSAHGRIDPMKAMEVDYMRNLNEDLRRRRENPGAYGPAAMYPGGGSAPVQAVPTGVPGAPAYQPYGGPPPPQQDATGMGTKPTSFLGVYKDGGMVQKFQMGGVPEEEEEGAIPAGAIPTMGQGSPYGAGARPSPYGPGAQPAIGGAPVPQQQLPRPDPRKMTNIDAVADSMKYGISETVGGGAIPPTARTRAMQAYAQGAGAAPADQMLALYKKIDPDGTKPESVRNLEAFGTLYRYKMAQGDQKGAQEAGLQMLQHYRTATMQYAAIGAAAMKEGAATGDPKIIDAGLKAIMKSYGNVLDGNDMKLWRGDNGQINFKMTGPDGKTVEQGIASPEQIMGSTLKLAGGQVEPYILAAAGALHQQRTGGGGGKGAKAAPGADPITGEVDQPMAVGKVPDPAKAGELRGQIKEAVNDFVLEHRKSDKYKVEGIDVTPKEIRQVNNGAYHIMRNNDVNPDEAVRLTNLIATAPEPTKKGERAPFKVSRDEETDLVTIRTAGGRTIKMPGSDFSVFEEMRNDVMSERETKQKKKDEIAQADADRGGRTAFQAFADQTSEGFNAITVDPETGKGRLHDTELGIRGRSAIESGQRAVGDAYTWLRDKGISAGVNAPFQAGENLSKATAAAAPAVGKAASEIWKGGAEPEYEDRPL